MFKRLAISMLTMLLLGGAASAAAWALSPGFRELVLLGGLLSGIEPIQKESAYALQEHPSERSALSLIAFVNLQHSPPVDRSPWKWLVRRPEDVTEEQMMTLLPQLREWKCIQESDGPEDVKRMAEHTPNSLLACFEPRLDAMDEERERGRNLARTALYSVCVLTGEPFGTDFDPKRNGYGTLTQREWQASLGELNGWTARTFGAEIVRGWFTRQMQAKEST